MPIVSIVLFVFGGAMLLYALITFLIKSIILPLNMTASVKNATKEYAERFAGLIAFISISFIVGAIFGLFIDIGLHNDGLAHISHLSKNFVKHPSDLFQVGDIVTCYVIDIDKKNEKVSLSLLREDKNG